MVLAPSMTFAKAAVAREAAAYGTVLSAMETVIQEGFWSSF